MLKRIGIALAGLAGLYLVAALALTFWPARRAPAVPPGPRPVAQAAAADPAASFTERQFTARDGQTLFARIFDSPSATTVLFVHGVGADGSGLVPMAALLHRAAGVRLVVLDLRGHGRSGGRRWSVDHAGQYEEDLADVLQSLRRERPGGRLVLAGHSMGGGIALRYALKPTVSVNGYLLVAPLLGGDAPSGQTAAPSGQTAPDGGSMDRFVTFRTPRLFGVLMFNLVGVRAFNDLPILTLHQPSRTPSYGFAALQSMQPNAPKDYRVALGAIHVPLMLMAGSRDEAFNARAYPGIVRQYSRGEAVIIPGETHDGVLTAPRAIEVASDWLSRSGLGGRSLTDTTIQQ
jgi:alpha-beta hydrolase superfamily lysophospholipase